MSGLFLLLPPMSRPEAFEPRFYGDPLAALELKRAEEAGQRLSKQEVSELGNRPVPEMPARLRASKNKHPQA